MYKILIKTIDAAALYWGGNTGLVVMGGDSRSKGCEFESQHRILDGHFFINVLVVKFVMCVEKDKNK